MAPFRASSARSDGLRSRMGNQLSRLACLVGISTMATPRGVTANTDPAPHEDWPSLGQVVNSSLGRSL